MAATFGQVAASRRLLSRADTKADRIVIRSRRLPVYYHRLQCLSHKETFVRIHFATCRAKNNVCRYETRFSSKICHTNNLLKNVLNRQAVVEKIKSKICNLFPGTNSLIFVQYCSRESFKFENKFGTRFTGDLICI